MKPEWRPYAVVGLVISAIALIAAPLLYFIYREFNLAVQICLALVVLGLAAFAILDPDRVRTLLTGRQARYGSNSIVLTLAFLGILVIVNYLAYQNSKRWDLTENKQYTLAKETIDTLASMPEAVKATAFFSPNRDSTQARMLLEQYKFHSDGKFTYEFIDPVDQPVLAEEAKITADGTIVLAMGVQQEQVRSASEQELTNGLVRLLNPEKRKVYFLSGHGEPSVDDSSQDGLAQLKLSLEGKNYTVETLNLLATSVIPEDANVVVVPGPKQPLAASEVETLNSFMQGGGAVIVMEEPVLLTDFGDTADPLADYLAQSWGINLGNNLVIDTSSQQVLWAVGTQWGSHAITQKMQGYVAILPDARSVSVSAAPEGVSQSVLVSTAPQAWGETDFAALKANTNIAPDEGADLMGPVSLAVAAENFQSKAKLVVYGDANFVTNGYFAAYGNADFFVNAVDWGMGRENLINLTPKEQTERVALPPGKVEMNVLALASVCGLPGLALVAGAFIWFRRRRRG